MLDRYPNPLRPGTDRYTVRGVEMSAEVAAGLMAQVLRDAGFRAVQIGRLAPGVAHKMANDEARETAIRASRRWLNQ